MIGLGVGMTTIALFACWCWWKGWLYNTQSRPMRAFLLLLVLCPFMAQIATQAGWFTAEMGRQPWVVYEVLKTGDAVSAAVHAPQVLRSIIMFLYDLSVAHRPLRVAAGAEDQTGADPADECPGDPPPGGFKWLSMRSRRQTSK